MFVQKLGGSFCAPVELSGQHILQSEPVHRQSVAHEVDDGATVTVLCATDAVAGTGGQYFEYTRSGVFRAHASSEESYDELKAKRLWEVSAELTSC